MLRAHVRAELERLLPTPDTPFALAFSGGPDSLALLNCLKDDKRLRGVLHVDHGLRETSAKEAVLATILGEQLGRTVQTLRWEPGEIASGLQERARRARYQLMGDWCRANGVRHLLVAHHADDQAETVLMRVERGSGWRGAAGMSALSYGPVWPELAAVSLVRPALGLTREQLHAGLGALRPISDPSNADTAFTRVRARERLRDDRALRDDMLDLSASMARGREAAAERLEAVIGTATLTHEGALSLPWPIAPEYVQAVLPAVGGQNGPAEGARTRQRLEALVDGKAAALGCGTIGTVADGQLHLTRDPVAMTGRRDGSLEPTAVQAPIGPMPRVWDGRFLLSGRGGMINPERRGNHVGYRILYRRDVTVENLVEARLHALCRAVP